MTENIFPCLQTEAEPASETTYLTKNKDKVKKGDFFQWVIYHRRSHLVLNLRISSYQKLGFLHCAEPIIAHKILWFFNILWLISLQHRDCRMYLLLQNSETLYFNQEIYLCVPNDSKMKRITEWGPIVGRRIVSPRLRWEDDVKEDLGRMKIHNWSTMAMDTERMVEQAKTHKEI